ncbi:MAG: hypothetical protein JW863_19590, partial [Chitinispirillaceae bacterium]|nr:hypothetical protein [Chitinispirillaceae bacterium]
EGYLLWSMQVSSNIGNSYCKCDTFWGKVGLGVSRKLNSITWTGVRLVAVGDSGSVFLSENGATWIKIQMVKSVDLINVAWISNQIMVLITPFGPNDTVLYTSNNNGISWSSLPLLGGYESIHYKDSLFVAVGGGVVAISGDGLIWELKLIVTDIHLHSVSWSINKFITVGTNGWIETSAIFTSENGISWQMINQTSGLALYYTFNGDKFNISVGRSGTILTSPDAGTWTSQISGTTRNLRCVTFTGTQYVAVGDSGTILTSPADDVFVVRSSCNPGLRELPIKSTANLLTVELPFSMRGSRVSVYSLAGKKIPSLSRLNVPVTFSINTRDLSPGVYQLVVERQGAKVTNAFIVGR